MGSICVIKANGERELFSQEKLRSSILRAGVPETYVNRLVLQINDILYPEIPTSIIYKHITGFLAGISQHAGKYRLKQAIMDLGPSGYPFEKLIAKLLSYQGYSTQTNIFFRGRCVTHEVDVVATKNSEKNLIECKFHNAPGKRTDVKVSLYIQSRYEDILEGQTNCPSGTRCKIWLVTNTKCTTDAISFANCKGIKIVSWGYPQEGNLQQMIEENRLYPLTCLTSLKDKVKHHLLTNDIVLCQDIMRQKDILDRFSLSQNEKNIVFQEIKALTT